MAARPSGQAAPAAKPAAKRPAAQPAKRISAQAVPGPSKRRALEPDFDKEDALIVDAVKFGRWTAEMTALLQEASGDRRKPGTNAKYKAVFAKFVEVRDNSAVEHQRGGGVRWRGCVQHTAPRLPPRPPGRASARTSTSASAGTSP